MRLIDDALLDGLKKKIGSNCASSDDALNTQLENDTEAQLVEQKVSYLTKSVLKIKRVSFKVKVMTWLLVY